MEGPGSGEGRIGPARPLLLWASCVTVASLALAEEFGDVLPAVSAIAGAAWVFGLDRRRHGA